MSFSHAEPNLNPWISEDSSLTAIKNALILGEKTGHIDKRLDDSVSEDQANDVMKQKILPSFKLIAVQREISEKRRQLSKVNIETQKRMLDKETRDITHIEELEKKIEKVKEFSNHIQSILISKADLVNRLQQPIVGDYIKMDAAYHKYVSEFFPLVTPTLGNLNMHLENITWLRSTDFSEGRTKLESVLTELTSAVADLQSQYQALCQMRRNIGDMYRQGCHS